jgi:hypothetical protein
MTQEEPRMMTIEDVATEFQCSTDHVKILESRGMVPPRIKLGNLVRYDRRAVHLCIDLHNSFEQVSTPDTEEAELERRSEEWSG